MAALLKRPASASHRTKRPVQQEFTKAKAQPAKRPASQLLADEGSTQHTGRAGIVTACKEPQILPVREPPSLANTADILKHLVDDDEHSFCKTFKSHWDCSAGGGSANMDLFLEAKYFPNASARARKQAKCNGGKVGTGHQVSEALAKLETFLRDDCAAQELDCAGDVVEELNFSTSLMGCSHPKHPEPGFEHLVESFQTTGIRMLEAVQACVSQYNRLSKSGITNVEVDSDDVRDIYGPAYCEGDNFHEIQQLQNPPKKLRNDRCKDPGSEDDDSEDDDVDNWQEIRDLQKSQCNVEVGRNLNFLTQGNQVVLIVTVSAKLRAECNCYNPVTGEIEL